MGTANMGSIFEISADPYDRIIELEDEVRETVKENEKLQKWVARLEDALVIYSRDILDCKSRNVRLEKELESLRQTNKSLEENAKTIRANIASFLRFAAWRLGGNIS